MDAKWSKAKEEGMREESEERGESEEREESEERKRIMLRGL